MMPWLHDAHMHHYACIAIHAYRLLDNLVSFGFGRAPTRPRKTDDRDRRSAAELSTPKHTASPDSSSCLQEGCRSAVHYTKYASAAPLCPLLPPSSSMCCSCRWPRLGSYPLYLLRLLSEVGIAPLPCPLAPPQAGNSTSAPKGPCESYNS